MRTTAAALPRFGSLAAQFVTFCGFIVIVAGLARIQKTTNHLGVLPSQTVNAYDTTYSYAGVTPYAGSAGFQFAFIWFIIFFELALLLFTLFLTVSPRFLLVGRPAALALLASAMTLVITVCNNVTYFHRSPVANTVYKHKDIDVTLAGAILVALGNAFTILTLGMAPEYLGFYNNVHHNNGISTATTNTPHNYSAAANQAKRDVEAGAL